MDAVLAISGLVKRFGEAAVVDGLTLSVAPGEVFGLVGPDGAGKTTTMRAVAGLVRPDGGTISVLGRDVPREILHVRGLVGYMPQQYSLYGDLSVEENLRFFAGMYGVPRSKLLEREKRLLGIARLEEFRDRPAAALSGGMYKKLALACALIHSPRLLLLDEPTNGVDPLSRRELWAFLGELVAEGVAVLLCTPYMDEAGRCDRVGLLVDGRLTASGSPADLAAAFDKTVFEIETEAPLSPAALAAAEPRIAEVYAVGRRLHAVAALGAGFAPEVEHAVARAGAKTTRVRVMRPSFEDIFLDLTRPGGARKDAP
ncbi:MAG: ABC transporter ATP-binding protein [Deltaproteobacteria bacterium]|nr:ABC transporter ATP-binding protein [Deltaproteobacteria bacterium]